MNTETKTTLTRPEAKLVARILRHGEVTHWSRLGEKTSALIFEDDGPGGEFRCAAKTLKGCFRKGALSGRHYHGTAMVYRVVPEPMRAEASRIYLAKCAAIAAAS